MNREKTNGPLAIFNAIMVVFILAPLIVVVYISFTPFDYLKPPGLTELSFRWYREIMERPAFMQGFLRSIELAGVTSTLSLIFGSLAAYVIARGRFKGRELLSTAMMFPLMIPGVVLGLFLLIMFSKTSVSSTFLRLIAGHVVITLPYAVRTMLSAFEVLDPQMEQAARNLGASGWAITWRIVLPLVRPATVATVCFVFIVSFDNLAVSLFLVRPEFVTLPVTIYNYITEVTDPAVAAVSTLLITLSYIIFYILERLVGIGKVFGVSGKPSLH